MSLLRSSGRSIADLTIKSMADIRPAAEAFRDIAMTAAQLRVAACANISSKEPMVDAQGHVLADVVFGWSAPHERWWEWSLLALESPLPLACRYESEPFWCNKDGIRARQRNPHLEALDLSDYSKYSLGKADIVVPVHLPFGQVGSVSFVPVEMPGGGERSDLSVEYKKFADELGLCARTFVSGYNKVMTQHQRIPEDCHLSEREVECLSWVALGKTDFEISLILARSSATIRFHIQRAATKLRASNRNQAVFRAAQLGYLALTA
jgi:LuxR family quorum-sensing system transcriptional regulator CciR